MLLLQILIALMLVLWLVCLPVRCVLHCCGWQPPAEEEYRKDAAQEKSQEPVWKYANNFLRRNNVMFFPECCPTKSTAEQSIELWHELLQPIIAVFVGNPCSSLGTSSGVCHRPLYAASLGLLWTVACIVSNLSGKCISRRNIVEVRLVQLLGFSVIDCAILIMPYLCSR